MTLASPRISGTSGRWLATGLAVIIGLSSPTGFAVAADAVRTEQPNRGEAIHISAGDALWEASEAPGVPGVVIKAPVLATWGSLERVDLAAGQTLFIRREKKLRACQTTDTFTLQGMGTTVFGNCLTDDNDDGVFDRVSYTDGGFTKKLDQPVPYVRATVAVTGDAVPNFKRRIVYLGADGSTLRLSYREFSRDMARPAFTEDISVNLTGSFPQSFMVKGMKFTITEINGMGMTYRFDQ